MAYRLLETEEEDNLQKSRAEYDIAMTVEGNVQDAIDALEDINNYGPYIANMRTPDINKAIEMYFGNMDAQGKRILPSAKASLEKKRGYKFPIKTKQTVDAFVSLLANKQTLLSYKVDGNTITFPKDENPSRDALDNILKTVMNNVGIKYKTFRKDSDSGSRIDELRRLIRKEIKEIKNK